MLLSRERGEMSEYKSFCFDFLQPYIRDNVWRCSGDIPRLGDVRGKMVLVYDEDFGIPGLPLKSFIRQNEWDAGTWKHKWFERADIKIGMIRKFLDESPRQDNDKMLMNNWNKQWNVGVAVRTYADRINARMQCVPTYPRGIQCMDYYLKDNVKRIIFSGVNMKTWAKR